MRNPFSRFFSTNRSKHGEFLSLTQKLIDIMVDFTLFTLRTVNQKKGSPLKTNNVLDAINFDLQFRLQQIQDPEFLDIIRERAYELFIKEQKRK